MRRVLVAVVVSLTFVLSACGSSGTAKVKPQTIADVKVTGGSSSAPKVDFRKPFAVRKTQVKVLDQGPGSGSAAKSGSVVSLKFEAFVGRDGASLGDNTTTAIRPWNSTPYTFQLTPTSVIKGLYQGLLGARAGEKILFTIAPKDAFDPTGDGGVVTPGDSIVAVVDLTAVTNPLTQARGAKAAAPGTVPSLKVNAKGIPTGFTNHSGVPKKVSKLAVYPVIKGTGPKIKSGQTITVQYLGQLYPGGKVFDQSWTRGQSFTFQLGTGHVIPGWDKALVGQRVGSRVVLVIPSVLGYGKAGSPPSIPKNADLIFSVDILSAY